MSDELILNGKTYVSSKKAAASTGYARDYIGQLSRGGQIDAERVGGLWYVSMDSLQDYERNAEIAKTLTPIASGNKEAESALNFEGREYISASRASKLTGYNQDYVGQLARGGKIPSRQIGNRWYVDREALVKHKHEKDSLLAAVQAEAVGLKHPDPVQQVEQTVRQVPEHVLSLPKVTYLHDARDLMPLIPEKKDSVHYPVSNFSEIRSNYRAEPTILEAKVSEPVVISPIVPPKPAFVTQRSPKRRSAKPYIVASAGMLTIILVLSVGIATTKRTDTFASIGNSAQMARMSAAAAGAVQSIGDAIEEIVSPELTYVREQ